MWPRRSSPTDEHPAVINSRARGTQTACRRWKANKKGKGAGLWGHQIHSTKSFSFCFWKCCFEWKIIPWLFKPLLGLEYSVLATSAILTGTQVQKSHQKCPPLTLHSSVSIPKPLKLLCEWVALQLFEIWMCFSIKLDYFRELQAKVCRSIHLCACSFI